MLLQPLSTAYKKAFNNSSNLDKRPSSWTYRQRWLTAGSMLADLLAGAWNSREPNQIGGIQHVKRVLEKEEAAKMI